jgi:hypothetical protein
MRVRLNHPHALYELQKIQLFRSSQWVLLKERNNRPKKITPFRNNELIQMLFVVVESTIAVDTTYSEELLHHVETLDAFSALRNHKLMRHLETGSVPLRFPRGGCRTTWIEKHPSPSTKPVIQPILISLSC